MSSFRFWKELSDTISRINEDDAYVDILKPDTMTKQPLDNKTRKKSDMVEQHTCLLMTFSIQRSDNCGAPMQ